MKAKYDIARLHADCVAWCENPQWKPWLKSLEAFVYICDTFFLRINVSQKQLAVIPRKFTEHTSSSAVLLFAELAGLDIEQYRIPEIDRDQAVRDYLASIEEGAPLWEGSEWVKETDGGCIRANNKYASQFLVAHEGKIVWELAYTFLRLDLREDKQ